uniref:ATP synthase subunit a n=1 Tax=Anadara vellicata TaxID=935000 RepID=A0A0P0DQQ3_9BIVA|nr:ATP synthase F0 subunit 6 [Anadara vellicata]
MVLSIFQEMDGWVSSGLFSGTKVPVMISWIGVSFLVCGIDGLWKTRFTVGVEYVILLYADLYQGVVKGFVHFVVTTGCAIFVMGMAGMVPGVMSWLEHPVLPIMLAFCFWSGIIIFGVYGGVREFCEKFTPKGMSFFLSCVVGCIEVISVCARPLIMSVRLMVNMVLGTVIIYTLGALFVCYGSVLLLIVLMAFFLYEIGVCFFQSYVFSMLMGLYMSEVEWGK